jgi:hypothetical protein
LFVRRIVEASDSLRRYAQARITQRSVLEHLNEVHGGPEIIEKNRTLKKLQIVYAAMWGLRRTRKVKRVQKCWLCIAKVIRTA